MKEIPMAKKLTYKNEQLLNLCESMIPQNKSVMDAFNMVASPADKERYKDLGIDIFQHVLASAGKGGKEGQEALHAAEDKMLARSEFVVATLLKADQKLAEPLAKAFAGTIKNFGYNAEGFDKDLDKAGATNLGVLVKKALINP